MDLTISHCLARIVYTTGTDANAQAYLSTAGRIDDDIHTPDIVYVDPSDIARHGKETLRIELMPSEFYDQSSVSYDLNSLDAFPEAWGYTFHSACWKILIAFRPITQKDLQSLLKLGRLMPKQRGLINWGHDYGGQASRSHAVAPGEESVLLESVLVADLDIDPGDFDVLHQIFRSHSFDSCRNNSDTAISLPEVTTTPDFSSDLSSDFFGKFPTEILFMIIDRLTLEDVSLNGLITAKPVTVCDILLMNLQVILSLAFGQPW
ncbi:hypothetical protein SNK03_006802 [Fusarium graminearum]|uniref:Uncharacterized protein n=1 Tax=Gibberella zeae TaxID=5518 RepID=A0A8H3Q008_GIBZA|nr:unnamed protein product [Fusarium graminearum]CAG1985916.1 unnamed protein product [Fusarium graminearum]CAG1994570.1 unnamed protein product [Fusarium graminearum]CAG1998373.1 unnamed protein product [Fusarium graminearum]